MLDELLISSSMLSAAIERYSSVCFAIQRSFARGEKPHITTPQLPMQIDAEVRLVASLEAKLRRAKAAINWSRNHSNIHVTINDLPPELLAYVFQLVRSSNACAKRSVKLDGNSKAEPMYPATFSLVCSRWREIAFNTPTLWSHLDISTSTLLNRQRLDSLMQLHLNQACILPLDLHVFDSPGYEISDIFPNSTSQLMVRLADRVVSFDLDIRRGYDYDAHYDILSNFLANCTPGQLKRLTLTQDTDQPEFIRGYHASEEDEFNDHGLSMDLPAEQFEDILSHVSVLRLNQFYPQWDSLAYHGLVELRLTGWGTAIPESELLCMLLSSPGLSIFQFSLKISNPLPDDSQITPIHLNDLEVLNLWAMSSKQFITLLRWLVPGTKPLQFAMTGPYYGEPDLKLQENSSISFFSRSRITKACGDNLELSQILELLDLSPGLQELAVQTRKLTRSSQSEVTRLNLVRQLERFHMVYCSVSLEVILALLSIPKLTIKSLTFHCCIFYADGNVIPEDQQASHLEGLSQGNPGVRITAQNTRGSNPIEGWDLFASSHIPRDWE